MKKYILTRFEIYILIMVIFSIILQINFHQLKWLTFIILAALGIIFEFLTKDLWVYNEELYKSPFTFADNFLFGLIRLTKRYDINLIFGLGWSALIVISYTVSSIIQNFIHLKYPVILDLISFGIIGNLAEQFYYSVNLFRYNKTHPMLKFPMFIGKYIEVFNIPLMVRLGYFTTLGLMVYVIVRFIYLL